MLGRMMGIVASALLVAALSATASQIDRDAEPVASFLKAVEQYVALHRRLAEPEPDSRPAATLHDASDALREQIKRARARAAEGSIFTPRAAALFKRVIAQVARGNFAALLKATHEDRDELGRALVNQPWPGTALTTMPPDLLAALPVLPSELEYRF